MQAIYFILWEMFSWSNSSQHGIDPIFFKSEPLPNERSSYDRTATTLRWRYRRMFVNVVAASGYRCRAIFSNVISLPYRVCQMAGRSGLWKICVKRRRLRLGDQAEERGNGCSPVSSTESGRTMAYYAYWPGPLRYGSKQRVKGYYLASRHRSGQSRRKGIVEKWSMKADARRRR